jgi:predicted amino acid racemase
LFLDAVIARNPRLIDAAIALHREAVIPPNSYVIDLDVVVANTALLREAALKNCLSLYFTTKQIGFNPRVAESVVQAGIPQAIAIDFREAVVLSQHHVRIGHMGHLVQLPTQMIAQALDLEPEVITVFGVEKARQISQVAQRLNKEVRLLLRVITEKDFFYHGQEGGIYLDYLIRDAAAIQQLPNVRIAGVTSFPCLHIDEADHTLKPTPNFYTILHAAQILHQKLGIEVEQINAPGNTCVESIPLLSKMGATHGEPGHALTGTTYLNTQLHEPETPALVYLSEVSHLDGDRICVFGGGARQRARLCSALVGSKAQQMTKTSVRSIDPSAIDYYISLDKPEHSTIAVGDSVIMAGRAQIFVSRAYVAVVQGIQTGKPVFLGLYDAWGRPVESIY